MDHVGRFQGRVPIRRTCLTKLFAIGVDRQHFHGRRLLRFARLMFKKFTKMAQNSNANSTRRKVKRWQRHANVCRAVGNSDIDNIFFRQWRRAGFSMAFVSIVPCNFASVSWTDFSAQPEKMPEMIPSMFSVSSLQVRSNSPDGGQSLADLLCSLLSVAELQLRQPLRLML